MSKTILRQVVLADKRQIGFVVTQSSTSRQRADPTRGHTVYPVWAGLRGPAGSGVVRVGSVGDGGLAGAQRQR